MYTLGAYVHIRCICSIIRLYFCWYCVLKLYLHMCVSVYLTPAVHVLIVQ